MSPKKRRMAQLIVSLILMAGLVVFIDVRETIAAFAAADLWLLFAALLLNTFNRLLMPVKWNLLLRAGGPFLSWLEATRIYYISSFLGLFLPPTVGSDALRAYFVSKRGYSLADVVSSILVERLLGLIVVLLFGIGGAVLFYTTFSELELERRGLTIFIGAFMAVAILAFLLSVNVRVSDRIRHVLQRTKGRIGKLTNRVDRLYESYLSYGAHRWVLFVFFALTCFEVCIPIVRAYVVGLALGLDVSLLYYFAFVPVILVLIRLPLSIDGFGIQEGGFVYFLALVGVSESLGFSVGLINHFVFLVALLPGGILYAVGRRDRAVVAEARNASN